MINYNSELEKEKIMQQGEPYLKSIKLKLVQYLFTPEILRRKDVSPATFSKITGVSVMQYYRYFKRIHMDAKDGFRTDLSEEEIADKLGKMMSYDELTSLYEWAKKQRFDKRKELDKRPYHLTKSRQKRQNEVNPEQQQGKNAKLIANMGVSEIEETPLAKTAIEAKTPQTTAEKLTAYLKNGDTTKSEAVELIKSLLGIVKPTKESTTAMLKITNEDKSFNRYQWAMEQYLRLKSKMIQRDFIKAFKDNTMNFGSDNPEQKILDAFRTNKSQFNLERLEEVCGD